MKGTDIMHCTGKFGSKIQNCIMSKGFKPSFGKKALSNGLSAIPDDIQLSYTEIPLYPDCTQTPAFPSPSPDQLEIVSICKKFEQDLIKSQWYIAPKQAPKASWEIRYADRYNPVVTQKTIDQSALPDYYPSELNIKSSSIRRKKIKRDFSTNILDEIVSDEEDAKDKEEEDEEEVAEEMEEDDGEEEGDYQGILYFKIIIVDYYADDLDMIGGDSGGEED